MADSGRPLLACRPDLVPKASYRRAPFTPRRFAHLNARFGALYDTRTEQVLDQTISSFQPQVATATSALVQCALKAIPEHGSNNLLELFSMHGELRLSVAAKMIPPQGIAKAICYAHRIDEYTRLLSYWTRSRTEYLSDNDLDNLKRTRPQRSMSEGTHVIVFISYGIEASVVLRLTRNRDLVKRIDQLLEKVSCAIRCCETPTLDPGEEKMLQDNIQMDIFANIPALAQVKSFTEFYRQINAFRSDTASHQPYNYNLCPIPHLFHVPDLRNDQYQEIPATIRQRIELQLLRLLWNVHRLRQMVEKGYPSSKKHLRSFPQALEKDRSMIDELEKKTFEPVKRWIVDVRSGRSPAQQIDQLVGAKQSEEWERAVQQFSSEWSKRSDKEQCLQELDQLGIDYRSASDYHLAVDDAEVIVRDVDDVTWNSPQDHW